MTQAWYPPCVQGRKSCIAVLLTGAQNHQKLNMWADVLNFTCMSIFSLHLGDWNTRLEDPHKTQWQLMTTTLSVKKPKKTNSIYMRNIGTWSIGNGICPCPPTHWEGLQKPKSCPAGRWWRRSICDLLCSSQSAVGGDDRRVATKLGQSPRSPGSRTKWMVSTAEKLVAVRKLPAHNQ